MIVIGVFDNGGEALTISRVVSNDTTEIKALAVLLEAAKEADPSNMVSFLMVPMATECVDINPSFWYSNQM